MPHSPLTLAAQVERVPAPDLQGELYTSVYSPQNSHQVLGAHNAHNAACIRDWLSELRLLGAAHKKREVTRKVAKPRKKKRRNSWDTDLDDFIAPDFDDDSDASVASSSKAPAATSRFESLSNMILLAGPSSTGKTSSVYAVAKELGWQVQELWPGRGRRSAADVMKRFEDAGSNQFFTAGAIRESKAAVNHVPAIKGAINSFFSAKPASSKLDGSSSSKPVVKPAAKSAPKPSIKTTKPKQDPPKTKEGKQIASIFTKMASKKKLPFDASITTLKDQTNGKPASSANTTSDTLKPPLPTVKGKEKAYDSAIDLTSDDEPTPSAQSSVNGDASKPEATSKPSTVYKDVVFLIEEVDILYQDDENFWKGLRDLTAKSKRPVIITANDTSHIPFDELPLQTTLYFAAPSFEESSEFLSAVCKKHEPNSSCQQAAIRKLWDDSQVRLPIDHPLCERFPISEAADLRQALTQLQTCGLPQVEATAKYPKQSIVEDLELASFVDAWVAMPSAMHFVEAETEIPQDEASLDHSYNRFKYDIDPIQQLHLSHYPCTPQIVDYLMPYSPHSFKQLYHARQKTLAHMLTAWTDFYEYPLSPFLPHPNIPALYLPFIRKLIDAEDYQERFADGAGSDGDFDRFARRSMRLNTGPQRFKRKWNVEEEVLQAIRQLDRYNLT